MGSDLIAETDDMIIITGSRSANNDVAFYKSDVFAPLLFVI
jgi:hypothetical protein